jgi:hypothetical protein
MNRLLADAVGLVPGGLVLRAVRSLNSQAPE